MIGIDQETRNTVLMTHTPWCRVAASAFTLALCWPNDISAQTEAGVARDAKSGAPLECLHVTLVDSTNRAVAHTVTDASSCSAGSRSAGRSIRWATETSSSGGILSTS